MTRAQPQSASTGALMCRSTDATVQARRRCCASRADQSPLLCYTAAAVSVGQWLPPVCASRAPVTAAAAAPVPASAFPCLEHPLFQMWYVSTHCCSHIGPPWPMVPAQRTCQRPFQTWLVASQSTFTFALACMRNTCMHPPPVLRAAHACWSSSSALDRYACMD